MAGVKILAMDLLWIVPEPSEGNAGSQVSIHHRVGEPALRHASAAGKGCPDSRPSPRDGGEGRLSVRLSVCPFVRRTVTIGHLLLVMLLHYNTLTS